MRRGIFYAGNSEMSQQKTLYKLLGISQEATSLEVTSAYEKLAHLLEPGEHGLSREDAEIKLKAAKQAYEVLSNDAMRTTYDARLAAAMQPEQPAQASQRLPILDVISAVDHVRPLRFLRPLIATLKAIVLLILIGIMLLIYRNAHRSVTNGDASADAASKRAEERIIIQQYYQENGVRPSSKIEADLLDAAARKKTEEERKSTEADRKQAEEDRKYRKFVEEGRRLGEQVSAELRRAEEAAQREDEYRRQRAEAEKRAQEEAETARIEREHAKWARQLQNH